MRALEIIFAEVEQFRATKQSARRADSQILKVILYGSYARGGWLADVPNPAVTGAPLGNCLYRFWTMGEVMTATIKADFTIASLDEHPDWNDRLFWLSSSTAQCLPEDHQQAPGRDRHLRDN